MSKEGLMFTPHITCRFVDESSWLVPEGRAGGKLSSPGAGSALELPDSVEAGAESESSLCGDLSPVRRSRLDVDDTTLCPSPPSRRIDAGRRQRQSRSTQVYSTGPDRLR